MGERGRPRGFDRDKALRRAMEAFWAHGYEATSMADLTAAMGIASPSIYACFGSKEQLFRATIEHYGASMGGEPLRTLREAPTSREGVEGMLRANAATFTDPSNPPGCMIVLCAAAGSTKNPDVQEFLAERCRGMQTAIQARLTQGVTDGELPAGTDTEAMGAFYTTVLQGLTLQARDGASHARLQTVVTCAMAAWDTLLPSGPPATTSV